MSKKERNIHRTFMSQCEEYDDIIKISITVQQLVKRNFMYVTVTHKYIPKCSYVLFCIEELPSPSL